MFNRLIRTATLAVGLVMIFESLGFAEALEGRVARVNARTLDMVVYDAQGRPYPNTLTLAIDGDTRFAGVRSAGELSPDDAIGAEVRRVEATKWRADSVTLFGEINAQPKTKAPSSGLRDLLGNPVARGALLGAATGAIAASGSRGKAGKGALIGAGVGAAVGLLEGLFSQRPAPTDDSR